MISLQSKGLWSVFSNTTVQNHQFSGAQLFYGPIVTSINDYWKSHSFWLDRPLLAMLFCSSLSPGVFSNSSPLSQWCHPIVSSSATPFSSYPQPIPASGSFPMSWLFASGAKSMGASASVLPMNIQGWFLLVLTDLISLLCKRLSKVLSSTTI